MFRLAGIVGWLLLALALGIEHVGATNCGSGTGTCFVTAAGGNWNANGTWSDSDGGGTCTCTPATGDELFITANSGNNTINAAITAKAVDFNGFTGTTTHNAAITVTINNNDAAATNGVAFRLAAGMTYTLGNATTSALAFTVTSGTATITTNGKTTGNVTFNGAGGTFAQGDALTSTGTITLTNGTWTTNNHNLSALAVAAANANTRQINGGTSTWTLTNTAAGAIFDTTGAGMTLNADTLTITATATTVSARSISLGVADTIGTVNVGANTSGGDFSLSAASSTAFTVGTLTVTGPNRFLFAGSGARQYTFTNAPTFTGAASAPIYLGNTTSTTFPTLNTANDITGSYISIGGLTIAGAGSLTLTNSFDLGGVTVAGGKTITPPSSGGSSCIGC